MVFSDEEKKYMLELYAESAGSVPKAITLFTKRFGFISKGTIRSYWKKAGFTFKARGGYRHGASKDAFMELYNRHRGDIERMITDLKENTSLKIKPISLVKRCISLELPYTNYNRQDRDISPFTPLVGAYARDDRFRQKY